jgi:hypothetical protein
MASMTIVAIHQPTYLPWMGLFHKLHLSDVFIVLDDVQLPKKAGSWVNRTKMLVDGESRWLTIPITRPSGLQTISDVVQFDNAWKKQHRNCIHQWYRESPHYAAVSDDLDELYDFPAKNICEINLRAIKLILGIIGSGDYDKIVMASSLSITSSSTQRLVDLVRKVNGTKYLCGGGSDGYLEPAVFKKAELELEYQLFIEHERPQLRTNSFTRGVSILDSILMVGPEETYKLLINA